MIISKLIKQTTVIVALGKYPVWAPFLIFLLSLFIIPNNKLMGLAVGATILFTLPKTKSTLEAIYYMLLLCLPFTKGKGFQFPILSADQTGYGIPYTFDFDLTFWHALLLLLIYLIVRHRKYINKPSIDTSDMLLALFVLSLIPSTLLSRYPNISLLGFTELLFMILLYFVTKLLAPYINMKVVSIIISLQLAFEGLWSIIQFILRRPIGNGMEGSGGLLIQSKFVEYAIEQEGFFRSRGTFDHSNSLGSFAISFIPFLTLLLIYKKNSSIEKALYTLGVILGTAAVIVSGSRTSIFITLIFFAIIFFISKDKPFIRVSRIATSLILGIFIFVVPVIILPRMLQLYTTLQEGGGLTYRLNLIGYSFQIAQQNLFGVGLGLYPKVVFNDIGTFTSYPAQPHNLFAQLAAEGGIISLGLFCILLFVSLRKFIKGAHPYKIALTASLAVMFLLSQVYPFLLRSIIFPYFWVFLAMGTKKDYNNPHEHPTTQLSQNKKKSYTL